MRRWRCDQWCRYDRGEDASRGGEVGGGISA